MVNVALAVSITLIWLFVNCLITRKDWKWYQNMLRSYKQTSKSGEKKKKLPNVSSWFFKIMWGIASMCAAIAIYIYFDGNCHFDQPRIVNEDDETDEPGWIRGLIVLLFMLISCALKNVWVLTFFHHRKIRLACIIIAIMVALNIVVLWAIGSTDQCRLDTLTNRYWISFGLYLIFTLWLCILTFLNIAWLRTIGCNLVKDDTYYATYKHHKHEHKKKKKVSRYSRYSSTDGLKLWYPHLCATTNNTSRDTQTDPIIVSSQNSLKLNNIY